MNAMERVKRAKEEKPIMYKAWRDAVRQEIALTKIGEHASDDVLFEIYVLRQSAQALYERLFGNV